MRVLVAAVENGDFDAKDATPALAPIAALRSSQRSTRKKGDAAEPTTPGSPEPMPPVDG